MQGESWLGYTRRVARHYGVTWTRLMTPALAWGQPDQPPLLTFRDTGTAAVPATLEHLARYFNLDPTEVDRMHLTRHLSPVDTWPPGELETLDPLVSRRDARAILNRKANTGAFRARVVGPRTTRGCPVCLEHEPAFQALIWRFDWYCACLEHGVLLTDGHQRDTLTAPHELIAAQQVLMPHLDPSITTGYDQVALTLYLGTLLLTQDHYAYNITSAHQMASVLPRLRRLLAEGPDAELLRFISWRRDAREALELVATHIRIDQTFTHLACPNLPHHLPEDAYIPDLSDILAPLRLITGRRLTAELLRVASHAITPQDAFREQVTQMQARDMISRITELEDEGRLERFWIALAQAAQQIRRADTLPYQSTRTADAQLSA